MGDRGGTATAGGPGVNVMYYTRWEIGGEPQLVVHHLCCQPIIPDGRSGGNRN